MRCARWRGAGRGVPHESARAGAGRLPAHPPGAGVQARPGGAAAGPVRRLPARPRRRGAHHRGCAVLGDVAHHCHAALVDAPAVDGARVRRPPACPRPARRGPTTRTAPVRATPANPVPLLPGRHRRARECRRQVAPPTRGGDLPDPDRPAGRDRDARRRGDPARPRRPRRRPRRAAAGARQQVRQVPPAPRAGQRRAADLHRGHPAWLQQRLAHLPPAGPPGRHHRPIAILPAKNPRPSPQLRGTHHARLVRPRCRRAGPAAQAVDLPGPRRPQAHLLVSAGRAGAARAGRPPPRRPPGRSAMSTLAPTLQAFFTDRLARQRQASGHTIAAYRDALKLLLAFAGQHTGKTPSHLDVADLDAPLIGAFLDHLEHPRGNSVRTRNARLAAIHSLFRFAALAHPQDAAVIQRVLAIPPKRYDQTLITYLTQPETDALLDAPDQATWTGRRDHALLALAVHTGLRVSELTALTVANVHLGTGAHVSCLGKGRKQRITPLTGGVTAVLRAWLAERAGAPTDPLFPTRRGTQLSPDAVQQRLTTHTRTAAATCPTLASKTIAPHVLRHTAAMRLLNAGVDTTVIALCLGHQNVATTQVYIHADLTLKEQALARTTPTGTTPGRYQPPDALIAFLEGL